MTSSYLADDLRVFEGLRLTAYPDPQSGDSPWTIGYGHTGREVHRGLVWTQTLADDALANDIMLTCKGLDTAAPWWRALDNLRQDCLANMSFNLGVSGLLSFNTFLGLVEARNFIAAANDVIHTQWAAQVGARASWIAEQMRTGAHQPAA